MLVTRQTRGVGPMLGWRWPIASDAGLTSAQPWANASCSQGRWYIRGYQCTLEWSDHERCPSAYDKSSHPANTKHLDNIVQFWTNVGPTLYKCYTNVLCMLGRSILWHTGPIMTYRTPPVYTDIMPMCSGWWRPAMKTIIHTEHFKVRKLLYYIRI